MLPSSISIEHPVSDLAGSVCGDSQNIDLSKVGNFSYTEKSQSGYFLAFPILKDEKEPSENTKFPSWEWSFYEWSSTNSQHASPDSISLRRQSIYDSDSIIHSRICDKSKVETLWSEKSFLDKWFDANLGSLYHAARQTVFPQERLKGKNFSKKINPKLAGVCKPTRILTRLLERQGEVCVLDLLGIKRFWADYLINSIKIFQENSSTKTKASVPVVGSNVLILALPVSLKSRNIQEKPLYSNQTLGKFQFVESEPVSNSDNYHVIPTESTGVHEILEPPLIDYVTDYVRSNYSNIPVYLCVADGAIKAEKDAVTGQHLENYHEIMNARCLLSQTVLALKLLKPGGDFVIKFFDTFSDFSISLIFILTRAFSQVTIIKPSHSRPVNSERYAVCLNYEKTNSRLVDMIYEIFNVWSCSSHKNSSFPMTLVPENIMCSDVSFMISMQTMATNLCERQYQALQNVRWEVEQRIQNFQNSSNQGVEFNSSNYARKYVPQGNRQQQQHRGNPWPKYISNKKSPQQSIDIPTQQIGQKKDQLNSLYNMKNVTSNFNKNYISSNEEIRTRPNDETYYGLSKFYNESPYEPFYEQTDSSSFKILTPTPKYPMSHEQFNKQKPNVELNAFSTQRSELSSEEKFRSLLAIIGVTNVRFPKVKNATTFNKSSKTSSPSNDNYPKTAENHRINNGGQHSVGTSSARRVVTNKNDYKRGSYRSNQRYLNQFNAEHPSATPTTTSDLPSYNKQYNFEGNSSNVRSQNQMHNNNIQRNLNPLFSSFAHIKHERISGGNHGKESDLNKKLSFHKSTPSATLPDSTTQSYLQSTAKVATGVPINLS